ncbi:general secretion pathway protein E [Sphingomonas sp. SORGH_AS802]|uniref:type II secretion system ATPase GspE n=1 Tax=unclassified Sphingomonas TaxID=196159 RepID=UPI00285BEC32|nr:MULTISPECIES: type II secretion system ATPase GspE [unclassified Sphingomonas]MDR6126883.1 general secretion pathway protein E [Sphingomonas sp. SORGH_AS_0438]MDR6134755.1 general secretion pathway protein E [Sphingomonas sp. SORGH_AS_0802]
MIRDGDDPAPLPMGAMAEPPPLVAADTALPVETPAEAIAPLPQVTIPYAFARKFGVVVQHSDVDSHLTIALREGADPKALIEVRRHLGRAFDIAIVEPAAFDRLLSDGYAMTGQATALAAVGMGDELDALAGDLPTAEDLLDTADDAPAIRLINGIIADATRNGVSDIHVEPYETGLVVRMRIDGVLRETMRMPPHVAPVVVSRIKVMARLDIAERRVPQDGRMGLTLGGKLLDVRVSTLPSRAGERVVLRILDKENAGIDLDALGMTPAMLGLLRGALAEPNGIILVTGPTGSGKTTSLYAALRLLNDGSRNILTVEDPVEYAVEGVGQTQVNAKVGLTFAAGLRAILRQDPDVVMVGEIRDRETAEIAVQASLTGHLVLSTVHTNDAVGAITRMRDMKVEPFLLASTLRAVIAQRLVRRLCPACRRPVPANETVAPMLGIASDAIVYQAVGCDECGHTGYRGRTGVYEAVRVDETIRRLINEGGDEQAIVDHAFRRSSDLASAARALVLAGQTTPEEAIRVSRRDVTDVAPAIEDAVPAEAAR